MLKIVMDTNLFISSIITPVGKAAQIMSLVLEGKIELLLSASILAELERVLFYPHIKKHHPKTPAELKSFIEKIEKMAKITKEIVKIDLIKDDPADNKYIECAIEGKADFIISGDTHLTSLKSFYGTEIVTPEGFLKRMEQGKFL